MIEVKNLCKHYGDKKAVNNISFEVKDGEILGFLGPNGAGKSTTMNMITGYISSTSGEAIINGVDIMENPKKAKSFIGYLPEIPPIYVDMTVKGYLNFVYDLKKCKLPRSKHIKDVCDLVKITDVEDRIINHRVAGYSSFDYMSGKFKNSDFGSYTLAVHSDVSKCIVVHHHSDKILVFNLGSDAETSAFLAELQARLP